MGVCLVNDPSPTPVAAVYTAESLAAGANRTQPYRISAPTEEELEDWVTVVFLRLLFRVLQQTNEEISNLRENVQSRLFDAQSHSVSCCNTRFTDT